MKLPTLSSELEQLVMSAVIEGLVPLSTVQAGELSKPGQMVHKALTRLLKNKPVAEPLPYKVVLSTCVDGLGFDRDDVGPYLQKVQKSKASIHTKKLLETVQNKQRLVNLINAASEQLAEGNLDIPGLYSVLEKSAPKQKLSTVADDFKDGIPDMPSGIPFHHLPGLSEATGGIFGMWAVAGEPGVGKSTFGMQMAVYAARHIPVLYYDFENGAQVILHRLGRALGGKKKLKQIRNLTKNLYLRESISTLDADLLAVPAPALIVIDSLQKLPADPHHRRTTLDKWILKLERLKKDHGYSVLLLSEKDRGSYESPTLRGFKESGEIEYSADFGAQLIRDKEAPMLLEFHVVKNRHRPVLGHAVTLKRVNGFWFKEVAVHYNDESEYEED